MKYASSEIKQVQSVHRLEPQLKAEPTSCDFSAVLREVVSVSRSVVSDSL